ncbi:hypothetical protein OROMI_021043 [Orobanche minor]
MEKLRTPHEFHHGDAVMEAIVKDRCGSVLGEGSKHKMYFFPGQRTSSYIQIYGAPHIFKVRKFLHIARRVHPASYSLSAYASQNTE